MQVSISKAHTMTGVARSTIYKDIDDGKLSCTTSARGKKTIMVSELQRVYGEIKLDDKNDDKNKAGIKKNVSSNVVSEEKRIQTTKPSDTNQIAVLQERIESLTLRMQNKEEFIDDLKEERKNNRAMFEEQIDSLKEALGKAQDGYNQVTKLLEHNSLTQEKPNDDWKDSIKALEEKIANQEKENKEKSETEAKQKELLLTEKNDLSKANKIYAGLALIAILGVIVTVVIQSGLIKISF
tara:strand:- start:844 stop:1560 length:717 start_codon:yes stop_codon:yes gene_type:complete